MMLAVELLSSMELLDGTGITYRQLDYWTRCGAIRPQVEAHGSGTWRGWLESDRARLIRIARLGRFLPLTTDLVAAAWQSDPAAPLALHAVLPADPGVELRLPAEVVAA